MARAEHATIRLQKSYSKRMSDHVAFALVAYTLALIFLVTPRMESDGTSIFPYFLLVILVAAVIAPCATPIICAPIPMRPSFSVSIAIL